MSDEEQVKHSHVWRVGDRAIINQPKGQPASIEAQVMTTFPISAADADKLRIKYPWIKPGEQVLVLKDRGGGTYHRIASDPNLVCVITTETQPTGDS